MNVSTTRKPFTKPLTGSEMRLIQQRISDAVRERVQPPTSTRIRSHGPLSTHEQRVKEVEDAIAFFEQGRLRRGSFPPVCKVPSAALSAVVGA